MTTCQSTSTQCFGVGPEQKTLTVKVPNQGQFRAGALTRHVQEWSNITDDYVTLQAIRGVKLPLIGIPPVRPPSRVELGEQRKDPVVDECLLRFSASFTNLPSLGVVKPERGPRGARER